MTILYYLGKTQLINDENSLLYTWTTFVRKKVSVTLSGITVLPFSLIFYFDINTFSLVRCPVDDTVELYPSPTGTFRFSLEAFEFVDEPFVFVHCHVIVCNATDPQSRCARGCEKKPRLRREVQHHKIYSLVQGPMTLDRNKEYKEPDNNLAIDSKMDSTGITNSQYFARQSPFS